MSFILSGGGLDKVLSLLSNKVDKVNGKGLSTNDYTNTDKNIVDNITTNLSNKADKSNTYTKTEVNNKIGNLSKLTTTDKSCCVAAINEVQTGLNYLHTRNLTFNASNMQDYLRQVIESVEGSFPVGYTLNMFGAWLGVCTFLIQASRATSEQTIVSAIPQAGNATVDKMWIAHKEAGVYSYNTIDMSVVN